MDGFFVDLDDLECAAQRLQAVGSDVDANSVLRYSVSARSMGSEELANALATFNVASRTALTGLRERSARIADAVTDSARTYRQADIAASDTLTEPTGLLTDNARQWAL